ncbi:MAG TPA: hypothetical protein VIE38_02925 [Gaiellaceae bacterium]|jgi:hypothetical protein
MEMKDRLAGSRTGVDDDTVVGQARSCSNLGDEIEHALVLACGELSDVVEALDVPLGDDEQVRRRLRIDVADRDEALGGRDVIAFAIERAEEAVVRQRRSPPR